MEKILKALNKALTDATVAAATGDDQAWYSAMHTLRATAWEGKEIIHEKRRGIAQPAARRSATSDLQSLGLEESQ